MGLDRFRKGLFGGDSSDEEEYTKEEEQPVAPAIPTPTHTGLGGIENNKMILFEPSAYSESQQIANYLKSNNAVIVNLKRVTPDQAKRIVDFISGTLYAIEGGLEKLGGGIFLCTPKDVPVEGKITDDNPNKGKEKPKKEDEKSDDEMDW